MEYFLLGDCYHLHGQIDTFLITNIFETVRETR